MKEAKKRGISFGATSGIITTLGLLIGLASSTASKLAVLGGIITIAIADAMSDALGIHISEEATNKSDKHVWSSTKYTFLTKFFLALTFTIPVLLFNLHQAMIISIVYGLIILTYISYVIARSIKKKPLPIIIEHLIITLIVIATTYFLGQLISMYFI